MGKGAAAAAARDELHFSADSDEHKADKLLDPIVRLNKLAKAVAEKNPDNALYDAMRHESTGYWDSPAFKSAMGMANPTIYVRRWEWYMWLMVVNAVSWISYFIITEPNGLAKYAMMFAAMWFYSDFKGGMLHIVLDTPSNIKLPLIGLPSLEFQLHHAIPQDIVTKGLAQACGDLNNMATFSIIFVAATTFCDPTAMALGCTVLLDSYCGQLSHQATHMLDKDRSELVRFLQRSNILLPPHVHRKHHQTHDKDFAILNGWSNPLLEAMLKVLPQYSCANIWTGAFCFCTIFDFYLMSTFIFRPLLGVTI